MSEESEGREHARTLLARTLQSVTGELRLAWFEWRGLLRESAAYEFEKRIESSPLRELITASLETIAENVKKISARRNKARLKLSRIVVRLAASVLNQNTAAFEAALRDLVELGKSVPNG